MIGIIDYGSGNIQAIRNIYKRLKIQTLIVKGPQDVPLATKLVLPGVGAFDEAIGKLDRSGLRSALDKAVLQDKVPVMGICVGMQIMLTTGEEGIEPGLNWIKGNVKKFNNNLNIKVPHMGWNYVNFSNLSKLGIGLEENSRFYFVHSYCYKNTKSLYCKGFTDYGENFTSVIENDNFFGVQFHPEKSLNFGIQLFKNFLKC